MVKLKSSTLLWTIALLTSVVAAANFYVGRNAEHSKRIWTEGQLEKVTQARNALQKEKEELTQAKGALEEQVTQLTTQAQQVAEQYAQEKRAREALTTELAQARKDAAQVKTQLDSERKEKQTLTEDLSKAKQSYSALSNELTTLRQAKEALEKRVKEMLAARAREAEQIVVKPLVGSPAAAAPAAGAKGAVPATSAVAVAVKTPEAKVLVVNKEFGFVVLNVGSKDGVRKGQRFSLVRDNKTIVTVEVDKVYDNMVAANLLEEQKKGEVREGDLARLIS